MDGGYKGWNPYRERHLAIFVNCQNFIPPLHWPTEEEAEYEAIMDYAANQAQSSYRHRDHKEVIKTQAKDVDPDMWWLGI